MENISHIREKKDEGASMVGIYRFTIRDAVTGAIKRVYEYKNLIPTVGRAQIAKALSGDITTAQEIRITHTSLGTGATAPANGDTQLQTEVFRKPVASSTFSNNVLYVTAFYTAPEVSGSFLEAGIHINATATANSGVLFSRVAISVTKSVTATLTIDYTVTIT